ncbi:PREDICTED: transmembrane protein 214-like [Camelina sativa]|uniref:Transmembrane protein 214-like n=1 Tax=Camelina sativa TaxID=90675 RepID=A0ABM1RNU8_CAMSA|nr:PREDICTED: transmembrane protein 214-like [Camelina sativa]
MLRWRPMYQGQDTLPVLVWMLAQATHGDLPAGLYSWAHVLLPLVGSYRRRRPPSIDLILQIVEMILSNPDAQTILVNRAVREGERLIPPSSFETLLRLTFPASSARVKATERFEAVYPLLKEVALAPETATGGNALEQIFTFSLKLAGEGNPGLAKEAAAIAIRSVTENVDCFKHWDILYNDHLEVSVTLLRKLVDEWKDHSPNLLFSLDDTLTVNRAMSSFRLKNEKAITEGGANCSLYKEADQSCKLILGRLSRESGRLNIAPITACGSSCCISRCRRRCRSRTCSMLTTSVMGGHKITPISFFICIVFN